MKPQKEIMGKYHSVVTQIIDLLKTHNVWFETFKHDPVKTSEEAAKIRDGYTQHQGAKAMILLTKRGEKREFIMAVLPGDKRIDSNKLRKITGTKHIRFATVEEISEMTNGVQSGGVPPFGNLFGLKVYVDPEVLENEKVVFNAGDRSFSIAMYSKDYTNLVNPSIESII